MERMDVPLNNTESLTKKELELIKEDDLVIMKSHSIKM